MIPASFDTPVPDARRYAWIGKAIVGIGVIHTLFGLWFMRGTLVELLDDGLFNTVPGHPTREAVFWFLFTGFALIVLGVLIHWLEARNIAPPAFLGWSLLALTSAGIFLMPASGFWLLLAPVAGLLRGILSGADTNVSCFPEVIARHPAADLHLDSVESHLVQAGQQQFVFMSFQDAVQVPEHSHAAQWAVILDGEIELTIGGHTRDFRRGDTYFI
ncbi:MAG: DUF6463 family protein, partial [Thermoanaerobaculia bacterium]